MVEVSKEFEMYRKIEAVAFRYFKMAEFLEKCLRFVVKTKDPLSVILKPEGYDNSSERKIDGKMFNESIYIPFNPFYLDEEEKRIWRQIYPEDFSEVTNDRESLKKALQIVWDRINEIKWWLGITIDTRYCGIRNESRLTTILENYLKTGIKEFKYDWEHSIFRNVEDHTIKGFISVMKNRKRKKGIRFLLK